MGRFFNWRERPRNLRPHMGFFRLVRNVFLLLLVIVIIFLLNRYITVLPY